MATYKEAAQRLGIHQTSVQRRMSLLGMKATIGADGRADVDPDEIEQRWQERLASTSGPGVEARFTKQLVVMIRPDQRAAIDSLNALRGEPGVAAVVRELIDDGLAAEKQRGPVVAG